MYHTMFGQYVDPGERRVGNTKPAATTTKKHYSNSNEKILFAKYKQACQKKNQILKKKKQYIRYASTS